MRKMFWWQEVTRREKNDHLLAFYTPLPSDFKKKPQTLLKLTAAPAFQGFKLFEKLAVVNTIRRHKVHWRGLQ